VKAVEISRPGAPDVLRPIERPVPVPGPGEVLVKVTAAGVNRPDLMQRAGAYPPPPGASDLPGLEVSGEVAALGPADASGPPRSASGTAWHVGEPVVALLAGGGYAEFCAVPGVQCLPVPAGLNRADAAAIPETFFTVWTNVFDRGRLRSGEWLLVHGGGSGIGTTAIQLAAARGAHVLATAGTDAKCRACERLGARTAINYKADDFTRAVTRLTGGRGADVILDMVGGPYFARNLEVLAVEGRLVQIATMAGSSATVSLSRLMQRRWTITGSTLRPRTPAEKGAIAAALEREVWPLLTAGAVRPFVTVRLPLDQAARAHDLLERGDVIGKIVLIVDPTAAGVHEPPGPPRP
jgi:putative PIG3 family NAD(P)H quinone oxidoreductase